MPSPAGLPTRNRIRSPSLQADSSPTGAEGSHPIAYQGKHPDLSQPQAIPTVEKGFSLVPSFTGQDSSHKADTPLNVQKDALAKS